MTMEFQRFTFHDIMEDKKSTIEERHQDLIKLVNYDALENKRCFIGNKFLYHHQFSNLCKVRGPNKESFFQKMSDDAKYQTLWKIMTKLGSTGKGRAGSLQSKIFEAYRVNNPVVFFKPTTAKYLYKKYNAKKVLDPTAGWGGRMIGAWALGIPYVGFDTNEKMILAYQDMVQDLLDVSDKLEMDCDISMNFDSCLSADFSQIDYDFVLTSPPYINLEVYEMMPPFESKAKFYKEFLIPLLQKCLTHIKDPGWVAFNISQQMYLELLEFGFRACDAEEDLLQQKRFGKKKEDKIYLWKKKSISLK